MRRQITTLALTSCLVLAAGTAMAQGGFCPIITVVDAATGIPVEETSGRIVDLLICVDVLRDPTSIDNLRLELVTPSGRHYTNFASTVGAGAAVSACDALAGRKAEKSSGFEKLATWDASFRLPVVGADISLNGLYGTWTLNPKLDNSQPDCSTAYTFSLANPVSTLFADDFESGSTAAWSSTGS